MSRKPYKQVIGLLLNPKFDDVVLGLRPPPYVNHDTIDFVRLADCLEGAFTCPEKVTVRVPNDTIDMVTIQFRAHQPRRGDPNCSDFAEVLLSRAIGAKRTIDVRKDWRDLHQLEDRTHAPPPVLIPFIVQGSFEAVGIWTMQAYLRLGMRAGDMFSMMQQDGPRKSDFEGYLPEDLQANLEDIFGLPFLRECCAVNMTGDPLPSWVED